MALYVCRIIVCVQSYRNHCKRIWKGDDFFKPIRKATPANILVKYSQLLVRRYCYKFDFTKGAVNLLCWLANRNGVVG